METKFMPGPWRAEPTGNAGNYVVTAPDGDDGDWNIAKAYAACGYPDRVEANAHLIAAAPELYEALVAARSLALAAVAEQWRGRGFDPDTHIDIQRIDAALRKARGEPLSQGETV